MNNRLFSVCFCLSLFLLCGSCTDNRLTEKEMAQIERYTKTESHDDLLFGQWKDNTLFQHDGKDAYIMIAFDSEGMVKEKMFVGDKAFNDWHFLYYYYTKDGKVFYYRPAESGFLAMDGEVSLDYGYEISADGRSLTIRDKNHGNKTYTKIEL